MSRKLMASIMVLLISGIFLFYFQPNDISASQDVFAGSNDYKIGPVVSSIDTVEDERLDVKFFASMGEMHFNSLSTTADWLSWEYSDPIGMDMTNNEAYWSFDQRDARDDSGNGHDGTVHGATATTGVFGQRSAMSFDGDDYIDIPHDDDQNITSALTMEAWIFPTFSDSGEHMIISKGGSWSDDDPQNYELTIDRDRPLFQMKLPASPDWYGAAPAEPISKNEWHHVAGVYDNSRFLIYIDGVNQTTLYNGWGGDYKGSVYAGGLPTSSYNISIGRRQPASWGSLFFKGSIDEVRIWDRALPANEILTHTAIPGQRCINLTGTPDNSEVGQVDVTLNITDNQGNYAQTTIDLTVLNDPPEITTDDVTDAIQDQPFSVMYDADDEGLGITGWSLMTNAGWLNIDQMTGELFGTPSNDDVGTHRVNVTFYDGKGGRDWSLFDLTVHDVNDAPEITTLDVVITTQNELYNIDYEATDIDGDKLEWEMMTDAGWLSIDNVTGIVTGIPTQDDVGIYFVNVTVEDLRGLSDFTNFTLEVSDANDEPIWVDIPDNATIWEGGLFEFDVNATDLDPGDMLTYGILSFPPSNISIDHETGRIVWLASREPFDLPDNVLKVRIWVSDGVTNISHDFSINVSFFLPQTTILLSPLDQMVIGGNHTTLMWNFTNIHELDIMFDVYLSKVKAQVELNDQSVMVGSGLNVPQFYIEDLEPGETYYWKVIPYNEFLWGECTDGLFEFYVNIPPTTQLSSPQDGSIAPFRNLGLQWNSNDIDFDGEFILCDVYIDTDLSNVEALLETSRIRENTPVGDIKIGDLVQGQTYYWTVIPHDGYSYGTCSNGIFSFNVNFLPQIDPVMDITIEYGKAVEIDINGTDQNEGHQENFEFFLDLDSPSNMNIIEVTGVISWTPGQMDIGTHVIEVIISDGLDENYYNFTIQVVEPDTATTEPEDDRSYVGIYIIMVVGILILIIVGMVIFLFMKRSRDEGSEEEGEVVEQPPEPEVPPQQMTEPVQQEIPVEHIPIEPVPPVTQGIVEPEFATPEQTPVEPVEPQILEPQVGEVQPPQQESMKEQIQPPPVEDAPLTDQVPEATGPIPPAQENEIPSTP